MNFIIALLFALILPSVIFLTTILYGGITNEAIKQSLIKADVYQRIGSFISEGSDVGESTDTPELQGIIMAYLTPDYAQLKTEEVIDSGYVWITDGSSTSPRISFPEIKERVMSQNPQLLADLSSMSEELKSQPVPEGITGEELEQFEQIGNSADMLTSFVQSDFSIPLGVHLQGIKDFYNLLKIVLPILLLVLCICLFLLGYLNKSWPARYKWIGFTLFLSAVFGFVAIAFQATLLSLLITVTASSSNDISSLFLPIAAEVMRSIVTAYTNYQGIASVILLILSAVCFVFASLTNKKPAIQPVARTKKK